ncbi:hypothetical protein J6P59_01760 [bacterium]|nr:hypothetical protein [bacterium]
MQQLTSLKASSLNIVYPDQDSTSTNSDSSNSSSNNTSTSSEIDTLEKEIKSKLTNLSVPARNAIENEIEKAIAAGNSQQLLNTLQGI